MQDLRQIWSFIRIGFLFVPMMIVTSVILTIYITVECLYYIHVQKNTDVNPTEIFERRALKVRNVLERILFL